MGNIKIAIIDDDNERAFFLRLFLEDYIESLDDHKFNQLFNGCEIVEISLKTDLSEMTKSVLEASPDCVLVDYRLDSQIGIGYNGVDLAESIEAHLYKIPLFILTSYEDDLFRNSLFSAYQVYDIPLFFEKASEAYSSGGQDGFDNEIAKKIVQESVSYQYRLRAARKELEKLLALGSRTAEDDSKILELDSFLEHSLDQSYAMPAKVKNDLSSDKFTELIDKVDLLLEVAKNGQSS